MNAHRARFRTTWRTALAVGWAALAGGVRADSISGTGFSADAIAEKEGATPDEVTDYDGLARWVYAEAGSPSIETTTATVTVPDSADRTFTSDFGTQFELQPYNQDNILLSGDTFTLDTPGSYADLQFLILGIGGNTADNFQATVNFSDASSTVLTFSISDWQASRAYNATERAAIARRGAGGWNSYFGPGIYPREIDFDLVPADQAKAIESIEFTLVDRLAVGAINGMSLAPGAPFAITNFEYDSANDEITLTWRSSPGQSYGVYWSSDMIDWSADLNDSVPAADPGEFTSATFELGEFGIGELSDLFFRVERN